MKGIWAMRCNKCEAIVIRLPDRTAGCKCDPDAPTWVAIQTNGRLITMSQADYEIID